MKTFFFIFLFLLTFLTKAQEDSNDSLQLDFKKDIEALEKHDDVSIKVDPIETSDEVPLTSSAILKPTEENEKDLFHFEKPRPRRVRSR